jgi:hypothetical protein
VRNLIGFGRSLDETPPMLFPASLDLIWGAMVRVLADGLGVVLDDIAPDWPQPHGQGGYRVVVKGEPNYQLDMHMLGTDGDHNTAGLKATAMRLVNAVPAVVQAKPGLVSVLDLPLVTGRGLVR